LSGFTDKNCSTNIDECVSNPCKNNGTCSDLVNDYSCQCVDGFTSKNCSEDVNDFDSNPCQNGGTCTDGVNGFTCLCNSFSPVLTVLVSGVNVDICNVM